jgi:hypothetical protein
MMTVAGLIFILVVVFCAGAAVGFVYGAILAGRNDR